MLNAKENSLFKDEWVLQFTTLLPDIPALWYQLLQLRDTQAPKIWGQPKVHQAPPRATSAETQQCSGTLMKFTYDKPSISQQVRTSSSHLIPPSSEFMRLEPSWTPCPPHLQLFHFFLLLLSGWEGLGHGGTGSVSIQCTWGCQHGTLCLLLVPLTSSGFLGLVILPFFYSSPPWDSCWETVCILLLK